MCRQSGGRSDSALGQGTPNSEELEEAGGSQPWKLQRDCGPACTLISASAVQTTKEYVSVILRLQFVGLCYGRPRSLRQQPRAGELLPGASVLQHLQPDLRIGRVGRCRLGSPDVAGAEGRWLCPVSLCFSLGR